jgi:FSR family fosmidomycin resistance protein-like MFS transporter
MTVFSIAWLGLLMGMVGFTWNYPSVVLVVGLGALGSAAFHPAGATLASTRGGNRRGAAMSVFSVGGNLGTALSPLLVAAAIGWFGLSGTLMVLPIALLASLFLSQQLSRLQNAGNGSAVTSSHQSQSNGQSRVSNGTWLGLTLIILAIMCRSWFQVSLVTYLPEWLRSQGRSLAAGGQILSVLLVSNSIGSLIGGHLSDRIGRWQVFVLSLGLLAPVHWLFLTTSGFWQVGLVALAGVLIGSSFPVGLVLGQETWPSRIGLVSALVMGLGWAPGGLGASVTGFVADQFSLTSGLQTLILPPLVGVGCVLAYVALQRRNRVSEEWRAGMIEG